MVHAQDKSVACVFVPGNSPLYGDHDEDPDNPGKCYCQSFLYHDTPDEMKRKTGYLMDEAEIQLGGAGPKVGEMVEVWLLMPSGEDKWWLCSVVHADESHIGITPPGYSMAEFKQQDGFEKVEMELGGGGDVTTCFRLPHDSARLNASGTRKTSIRVGQAPFGCVWYGRWVKKVVEGEEKGQRAVIVYKKGLKGVRSPGPTGGLGYSQMQGTRLTLITFV